MGGFLLSFFLGADTDVKVVKENGIILPSSLTAQMMALIITISLFVVWG